MPWGRLRVAVGRDETLRCGIRRGLALSESAMDSGVFPEKCRNAAKPCLKKCGNAVKHDFEKCRDAEIGSETWSAASRRKMRDLLCAFRFYILVDSMPKRGWR